MNRQLKCGFIFAILVLAFSITNVWAEPPKGIFEIKTPKKNKVVEGLPFGHPSSFKKLVPPVGLFEAQPESAVAPPKKPSSEKSLISEMTSSPTVHSPELR